MARSRSAVTASAGPARSARAAAGRIVLAYALLAALWILFSDTLVAKLFPDPDSMRLLSIAKGWLFVLVTASLLYALIARQVGQILQKEEAAALSDRRFREALEAARHLMYRLDVKGCRYDYLSPSVEALTGFPLEEYAGFGMAEAMERFHPDDREKVARLLEEATRQGTGRRTASLTLEYRFLRKDGQYAWLEDWTTVFFDEAGRIEAFVGTVYDITDRKESEEQLRQAQKMESVGRLAGGIAHDFNNLLTVIIGQCGLALRKAPPDSAIHLKLHAIRDASQRAAVLTQQLLAFSRKQHLQSRLISLNEVVADAEGILGRVIGEDIALATRLAPDLGSVKADPGQFGQVLINLAVNARDAMPGGGRLLIETGNVGPDGPHPAPDESPLPPVPHVFVSVSDTGTGMTEEVRRKAFEPFFTTKGVGEGTGLGLSMVYGIVAQSGGRTVIESSPGAGTTVRIFLPRAEGAPERIPQEIERASRDGSGAILIVEDEEQVRKLMAQILSERGYRVAEATDGLEGLKLLRDGSFPCDLLITDLVMPGMGGSDLAARAREIRRAIRVLYISGYAEIPPAVEDGAKRSAFLRKPFGPDAFLEKVQEMI
jgi:PAS domain S-box-containing protein